MHKYISFLCFVFLINSSLEAQGVFGNKKKSKEQTEETKKKSITSIKKKTKNCIKYEGLFDFYLPIAFS